MTDLNRNWTKMIGFRTKTTKGDDFKFLDEACRVSKRTELKTNKQIDKMRYDNES